MGDLFILVVSSDNNFRDYICNYLLMDGHYVDTANQSQIARQMLQRIQYDLVLLSISSFDNVDDILTIEEVHEINTHTELVFLFNPICNADNHCIPIQEVHNCLLRPFILQDLPAVLLKVIKKKDKREVLNPESRIKPIGSQERRRFDRIPADIPIKYTFVSPLGNLPSEESVSKLVNMSQEGLMFRADLKTKLSEFVYLHILLPTSSIPINIEGEIRWERFKSSEPWRYVGVCFSTLNPVIKKQIASFIESKQG